MKRTVLFAASALLFVGCQSYVCPWCGHDIRTRPPVVAPETLPAGTVEGEVISLERSGIHPLAKIVIQLHDLSVFAGVEPKLMAETTIDRPAVFPIPFQLPYPADTLVADHDYSLSARLMVGNDVLFKTDTRYPVLTRDAPSRIQLVLMRVRD